MDLEFITDADTTASSPVSIISNHDLNADDTCSTGTVIANDSAGYICVEPDHALDAATFWVVAEFIPLQTTD
jgi:hypothetical protein